MLPVRHHQADRFIITGPQSADISSSRRYHICCSSTVRPEKKELDMCNLFSHWRNSCQTCLFLQKTNIRLVISCSASTCWHLCLIHRVSVGLGSLSSLYDLWLCWQIDRQTDMLRSVTVAVPFLSSRSYTACMRECGKARPGCPSLTVCLPVRATLVQTETGTFFYSKVAAKSTHTRKNTFW